MKTIANLPGLLPSLNKLSEDYMATLEKEKMTIEEYIRVKERYSIEEHRIIDAKAEENAKDILVELAAILRTMDYESVVAYTQVQKTNKDAFLRAICLLDNPQEMREYIYEYLSNENGTLCEDECSNECSDKCLFEGSK